MWRWPVSRSAGFLPLKGCVTPCMIVNLPSCQKNNSSLQRRKTFTVLKVVTLLPNYTQSLLPNYTQSISYETKRSHSPTKLHAITLLPNYTQSLSCQTTRSHSSTKLHAVTLLPNYTHHSYQTTLRHSSTKLRAVTPIKLRAVTPTKLHAVTLHPNYTPSLFCQNTCCHSYQTKRSHSC